MNKLNIHLSQQPSLSTYALFSLLSHPKKILKLKKGRNRKIKDDKDGNKKETDEIRKKSV